jgi:microcystin-dependent protein
MAWDKNNPVGSLGVNVGDDSIRANFDWLEASLSVSMIFPGTSTTRGRLIVRKGTKATRNAITSPQEGEWFIRTDISPGAIDVYEGGVWKRRVGPQVGDLMPYSGNPANIAVDRPGWALCDGSTVNGFVTPNLKGKFVVGYDSGDADYNAIGDTGGTKTVTLSISNMPAHNHPGSSVGAVQSPTLISTYNDGTSGHLRAGSASSTDTSNDIPPHTHTLTIASQGSGTAFDTRPPFYTLAWLAFVDV